VLAMVADARARKERVAEQLQAAAKQSAAGRHQAAWIALQQATNLESNRSDVRLAQENVAMAWLRQIRGSIGPETFTDIATRVQPTLMRGIAQSVDQRKADLAAHLGWADFLLWRDGHRELVPDRQFQRAVESDSLNPYAHAMWAYWIVWQHGPDKDVRAHFDAALRSGREPEFVRSLQIAVLARAHTDSAGAELLRIAEDMLESGVRVAPETRRDLADGLCLDNGFLRSHARAAALATPVIAPEADLITLTWLLDGIELRQDEASIRDYCLADAEEIGNKPAIALATLKAVRNRLPDDSTSLLTDIDARMKRLTRSRR
jgi:hypothetical protein